MALGKLQIMNYGQKRGQGTVCLVYDVVFVNNAMWANLNVDGNVGRMETIQKSSLGRGGGVEMVG